MKKFVSLLLTGVLAFGLLAGCGNSGTAASPAPETTGPETAAPETGTPETGSLEGTVLKVGATPAPHAEILEVVKQLLAEQGITLEITVFNDYIQPNTAVENGDLDANYFQHITYMDEFNASNGTHLVSAAAIHYEPFGLYAGKTDSLDALADGAQIAVPNDTTNEARALLLLQQEGLITLKEGARPYRHQGGYRREPQEPGHRGAGGQPAACASGGRGYGRHQRQLRHRRRAEGVRRPGR